MVIALFEEKYLRNGSMKESRIVSHGPKRVHSGLNKYDTSHHFRGE
jgi:hypothetical protein